MELNTVFFCTTIGALVGTIVGILLMNRKVRLPITGADLAALRSKLEAAESSLAAAQTAGDDLRKQLAEREQSLQQQTEELKRKQEQLDKLAVESEKEKLHRSVNEQLSQELSAQNATLAKERGDLESQVEEERRGAADKAARIASLETQLEFKSRQIEELSGRVDGLTAETAALRSFREQESRRRVSLEAQLAAEQEQARQLSAKIAELESERSRFDRLLQEERESAARGMELLMMAQENFSRVLTPVNGEVRNGEIRHLAIEPNHSEADDTVPSAASAD
ncbi:MAG TPA: hypothetical protein VKT49_02075 [Bryobacteraceae bacterium]|nr:hypothetical protein [Bryobacteraceae bacterium]